LPRSAREVENGTQTRIDKIQEIIKDSKYGIHDISCTELCDENSLPRFNMPFELGLFMSAKTFGQKKQKEKSCLILDREKFRFQRFLSDIAGQDIRGHRGDLNELVKQVSAWLKNLPEKKSKAGGTEVFKQFSEFNSTIFPVLCAQDSLESDEVSFNDYSQYVSAWLSQISTKSNSQNVR
jgi:hypothetical protein